MRDRSVEFHPWKPSAVVHGLWCTWLDQYVRLFIFAKDHAWYRWDLFFVVGLSYYITSAVNVLITEDASLFFCCLDWHYVVKSAEFHRSRSSDSEVIKSLASSIHIWWRLVMIDIRYPFYKCSVPEWWRMKCQIVSKCQMTVFLMGCLVDSWSHLISLRDLNLSVSEILQMFRKRVNHPTEVESEFALSRKSDDHLTVVWPENSHFYWSPIRLSPWY